MRTPEELKRAVASLGVETNEIYQPGYLGVGFTWCNRFVSDATALLGCQIPFRVANEQLKWLEGMDGANAGWAELPWSTDMAKVTAALVAIGRPTVAAWGNPKGHGHVALCVPGPIATKLFIAQAGSSNFSCGPIGRGFGTRQYRIFTHE